LRSVPPYVSSAASEAIDLAERAGLSLDDWQRWVLTGALGERADGKFSAWEVCLIVSRQNGKNAILEARELAGLFVFGEQMIIHTAHRFDSSAIAFRRLCNLIEACPDLDREVAQVRQSHGQEAIILRKNPGAGRPHEARIEYKTRSESAGRAYSADLVVYDEAMILDSSAVGGALPTMSARQMATDGGPQVWYTASAGIGHKSTQLALLRGRLVKAAETGVADASMFAAEWSIEPHDQYCEPRCSKHIDADSLDALYLANPGLGIIHRDGSGLTLEACERERNGMDEQSYLTERLSVGVYPAPKDGWAVIPRRWWKDTEVTDSVRPAGVVFGVDSTPDGAFSAVAVAGEIDGEHGYVELCDHRPGRSWVLRRAIELDRRWGPTVWVIDPRSGAGPLIDDFDRAGLKVVKPTAQEVAHAFGDFYDAVRENELRHAPDREVANALAGAATRKLGDGLAWDRVNSGVDICPVVAYTFAWWGWRQHGGDGYDAGESVHFDLAEIIRLCKLGAYGPGDLLRLHDAGLLDDDGLTALAAAGVQLPR